METSFTKKFKTDQPIDQVWENLTTPEKVVVCVPGASLIAKVDEDNYKGGVVLKFGPVKAAYDGLVTFIERDAPNHKMTLKGSGTDTKGKGSAEMMMYGNLQPTDDGGTEVEIKMDVSISGMLAQFGSRLINDVSNHVLDQFIGNFKSQLSGQKVDNTLTATSMIKGFFGKK